MDYRQMCQTAQANSEHLIEQRFLPVSLPFSFSLSLFCSCTQALIQFVLSHLVSLMHAVPIRGFQ